MITADDFDYVLPKEAIAQFPAEPRDSAKLLNLNLSSGQIIDQVFSDLSILLTSNDVLVLNNSKVFPARIKGVKRSGGHTEVLLLHPLGNDIWEALGRDLKPGHSITCHDHKLIPTLKITVESKIEPSGHLVVKLTPITLNPNVKTFEVIESIGLTPIPPYIATSLSESSLRSEYQTVYAKDSGSAAAPTAGMHFTSDLLTKLRHRGVQIEEVTLHVGAGTFAKLMPEQIKTKTLHTEWYEIQPEVAARLNAAKSAGKRIIAVGTTSCRTLESACIGISDKWILSENPNSQTTNLFIQPGYQFKFVDALITNFHLPKSSLLMLVTAFELYQRHPSLPPPDSTTFTTSLIRTAYLHALANNYRFFSFGDAMFIH